MLKSHPLVASATGRAARPALAFTGVSMPDPDDRDPQPPSPPNFFLPLPFDDGGLDLGASMLGAGAMSFVPTDALRSTMAASAMGSVAAISTNSVIALQADLEHQVAPDAGILFYAVASPADRDPQPPSPPIFLLPPLFEDGGLDLKASMLGAGAMSFVLTDAPGSTVAASATGGGTKTSANSAIALHADVARSKFNLSGVGVRIGIMSNSFDLLGGYARDVANGDLPGDVHILKEGAAGDTDEGRAMADLVHQVAPDASIYFYTATGGETDFAAGILALQAAGCQVIVDDVTYLDEPFFQDGGVLQQAVETVIAAGTSYFTSASNEGRNFFEAAWTPVDSRLPGLPTIFRTENFGSAEAPSSFFDLSVPCNGTFSIDLQWDQPSFSISGGSGSASSLAMALYAADGTLIGTVGELQVHKDSEQLLQYTNRSGGTDLKLAVFANGLAAPSLLKLIVYGNAALARPGVGSGTVTGHELVSGANTVGAINYAATPAFGGDGTVEGFSSVGSGKILFDAAGNRLGTPIDAGKVSFVAPDGSVTSVLAPFYGTSAGPQRRRGGGPAAAGRSGAKPCPDQRHPRPFGSSGHSRARRWRRRADPGGRGRADGAVHGRPLVAATRRELSPTGGLPRRPAPTPRSYAGPPRGTAWSAPGGGDKRRAGPQDRSR